MWASMRSGVLVLLFVCISSRFPRPVNALNRTESRNSSEVMPKPCFPGFFIFGDSLVDDGNAVAVYPEKFAGVEKDPYSVTWPGHDGERFSDGKLLGDYLASGVGIWPMTAYLKSVQPLLTMGVNLAVAGSMVLPDLVTSPISPQHDVFPHTPFTLHRQIQWYHRFKARVSVLANSSTSQKPVLSSDAFNSSLHLIFAGYTDYIVQYLSGVPEQEILASVPKVVTGIRDIVETLHATDAVQNIMVVNLPPLGCTPGFLTLFPGTEHDEYGCLTRLNNLVRLHNKQLNRAVIELQVKYSLLSLSYGDYYRAVQDILQHPLLFGFNVTENLLTACCGAGGKYNFDTNVTCGIPGFAQGKPYNGTACTNPSGRLFWDGFHPTGAVNRLAALSFLNGISIYPADGLVSDACKPNYTGFGPMSSLSCTPRTVVLQS